MPLICSRPISIHRVAALMLAIVLSTLATAQDPPTSGTDTPTNKLRVPQKIAQHVQSGASAYRAKNYEESLAHYTAALDLGEDSPTIAYNAACSASLAGKRDQAISLLETAIALGYVDASHLGGDGDLAPLHADPRWKAVLAKAAAAERSIQTRWNSSAFETPFEEDISDSEKAAGLARLWSEVKFNFVHFDQVPDLDWDAAYMDALPRALATTSTLDYYLVLRRLVASLNDGHTNVYLPPELASMERSPGITTQLVEGRVVVVAVWDRGLTEAGVTVGMEITKVDGVDVKVHAAQNVAPFICASTPQDRRHRLYGQDLLRGPLDTPIQLTIKSAEGIEEEVKVKRQSRMVAGIRRFTQPRIRYKVLDENIGYLQLNSFSNQSVVQRFKEIFPKICKADSLIIDLRKNGGGNSGVGWEIMTHLVPEPFSTTRWHTLQYRPTMRAWGRQPVTPYGSEPRPFGRSKSTTFDRPVVMLIGPGTFSAAEDMVAVFDQVERGKLIGEATGGSSGQPLMFDLPGGGKARVCTKHDFYADGTEFVGVGIAPDKVVQPTISDLKAGIDTVLQAAIEELK